MRGRRLVEPWWERVVLPLRPLRVVGRSVTATVAGMAALGGWAVGAHGDGTVLRNGVRDFAEAAPAVQFGGGPVGPAELGGGLLRVAVGGGQAWVTTRFGVQAIDEGSLRAGRAVVLGHRPDDVAVVAGKVWIADRLFDRVVRIDARSGQQLRPLPVRHPVRFAVGLGSLWVASASGRVTRVNPRSAHAVGRTLAPGPGLFTAGLAVDAGGVWLSDQNGTVVRFDVTSGRVRRRFRLGSDLGAIAAAEGAVWVATSTDGDGVTRIDPRTGRRSLRHLLDSSYPDGVAVGAGSIWVASPNRGTITRIDPLSFRAVGDPLVLGDVGDGIAFGDGALWVPHPSDATISIVKRTDPSPVSRVPGGPIDEVAGTYKGMGIGDTARRVRSALGPPGHWSMVEPIVPLDVDFLAVSFGPPVLSGETFQFADARGRALRYGDVFFYLCGPRTHCHGRVAGFEVYAPGSRTARGIAIGDRLSTARGQYQLTCHAANTASDEADFPYCEGQVAPSRYIFFSNDPIDDIEVAFAPFR